MGRSFLSDLDRLKSENESLRKRLSECGAEFTNFLYAVAHDLRSPMINIRGLAIELRLAVEDLEPLKSGLDTEISQEQWNRAMRAICQDIPDTLGHIDDSVSRMSQLMNHLIELSRIAHEKFEFSTIDLSRMVHEILAKLSDEIHRKSCAVEVGDLPELYADPLAVERILSHLISNALKFLEADRPGRMSISGGLGPDGCWISVADNGRGIAEQDLKRIFAPFRRAGKLDTSGEGMGLAVVNVLVRRHSGFITCVSSPGEGAQFTITLPQENRDHD